MNFKLSMILSFLFTFCITSYAQQQPYDLARAYFSTDIYDEFAPTLYKNGIVFCSDRGKAVNNMGKGVLKMFYADTAIKKSSVRLFSKDLKSKLNEGPATFNRNTDTIFYSRNLNVDGNYRKLSSSINKLGLFTAVLDGKHWTRTREMRFNTEWFNITMPCLSPDGKRLYFASDKPGGYGGMDIYYSQRNNNNWEDPVNLGMVINTKGNETYPFVNEAGELYFSSDGHPGLGGKDIFVTIQNVKGWNTPVQMDAPVNSVYNDFGIITHSSRDEGYFSSDRGKTIDVFKYSSEHPHIWFAEPQNENSYCIKLTNYSKIQFDTIRLQHQWNFGDKSKLQGSDVVKCFQSPGTYDIKLDITDKSTGRLYFQEEHFTLQITDHEQPYINAADHALVNDTLEFDGLKSYCPGYDITGYYWDFGDGTLAAGEQLEHVFKEPGEFFVRLGLTLRSKDEKQSVKKAVIKKIEVFNSDSEMFAALEKQSLSADQIPDIWGSDNIRVVSHYSAGNYSASDALFMVEILSSDVRIGRDDIYFKNVPSNYRVKEVFDPENNVWNYFVDEQVSLMAVYPAYIEMINKKYETVRIKLVRLIDPAEKELFNLEKNFGVLTDLYFDSGNKLVSSAYLMLDQVVILMNKYPSINLIIGVHTDSQGITANLLTLSQNRANVVLNYLTNRGISSSRVNAVGYGASRPVSLNTSGPERKQNRRIDFTIINE
jgi:outer membrane protein OmpA-like peptidoglycan-associated protein